MNDTAISVIIEVKSSGHLSNLFSCILTFLVSNLKSGNFKFVFVMDGSKFIGTVILRRRLFKRRIGDIRHTVLTEFVDEVSLVSVESHLVIEVRQTHVTHKCDQIHFVLKLGNSILMNLGSLHAFFSALTIVSTAFTDTQSSTSLSKIAIIVLFAALERMRHSHTPFLFTFSTLFCSLSTVEILN